MTWGSLSGMEVGLYTALSVGTLLAYLRALESGRPWWGLLAGLAGTARPETFIVLSDPGARLDDSIAARTTAGAALLDLHRSRSALFAIPAAAFVGLNYATSGHPLPLTFYAKTYGMGTVPSLMEGRWHDALTRRALVPVSSSSTSCSRCARRNFRTSALGALVGAFALLGLIGSTTATRRLARTCCWRCSSPRPLLKGLVAPEPPLMVHEGRYLFHLLAIFVVVAVVGVFELQRLVRPAWVITLFMVIVVGRDWVWASTTAPPTTRRR